MSSPEVTKTFLGRYELQKKLAVGGMAEIYLAQVSGVGGFQKQVVVKRILPQLAESEELFHMFLDEARIAATLQHPNVVQVYDACHEDGEYFMAMEYLDGTDLRTLRKVLADRVMPLPWEHALFILQSICAGLHYAHDKRDYDGNALGIVHRDVTPHNIFITRDGTVKLVDFGIAKAEGRTTETAMGTLKGKLAYMSPEQCVGDPVDRRSDIYSLGIILYELTTGKRLYQGKTEYQLLKEIVEAEIQPPSSFMDYPPELEALVMRCLEKKPENRYQSARDVQQVLEGFARDYQLTLSSLSLSTFLEPLLEDARRCADERWKNRHDSMPIRLATSDSKPRQQASELPSLEALHRHAASSPATDEPMTARVPEDLLAQLRAEEKELALDEQRRNEADAVPRYTVGSTSSHVVRRAASPEIDIDIEESLAREAASPIPPEEEQVWESAKRATSQERALLAKQRSGSTQLVAPLAMPELSDEDMRVTRKSGGLWIFGLLACAAISGAMLYSKSSPRDTAEPPPPPPKAQVSSLAITGTAGAEVWMFLGRTPIQVVAINSESEHRVRLEHEGYYSVERTLSPETWQRDASGSQFAAAEITLQPVGSEMPSSEETSEGESSGLSSRPASLRLKSTPAAANAWLFVGTTPDVKIGNLNTDQEVQLRIEREGQPPSFRVVQPNEFSASGETRIELVAPQAN